MGHVIFANIFSFHLLIKTNFANEIWQEKYQHFSFGLFEAKHFDGKYFASQASKTQKAAYFFPDSYVRKRNICLQLSMIFVER